MTATIETNTNGLFLGGCFKSSARKFVVVKGRTVMPAETRENEWGLIEIGSGAFTWQRETALTALIANGLLTEFNPEQ